MELYYFDPLENDPQIAPILKKATELALEELNDHPIKGQLGFCHIVWAAKKRILKEQYSIDWNSPNEYDINRMAGYMID